MDIKIFNTDNTIKEVLNYCKGNKYIYHNLDNNTKKEFKELYNYIKKNKNLDKKIPMTTKMNINRYFNDGSLSNFVRKYKTLYFLSLI